MPDTTEHLIRFHFDVGSPYAYLAAERLHTLVPEPVEWQPVLLGGLFGLTGRSSWALGDHRRRQAGMAEIERRGAGFDPAELDAATRDPDVKRTLREATAAARALGVFGVPTLAAGDDLFWGDDRLEDAAAHLAAA